MNNYGDSFVLSINDDISNLKIYEIINRYFGRNYKAWMKAWYEVNDEYAAWFPTITNSDTEPNGSFGGTRNFSNTISADGTLIREINHGPSKDSTDRLLINEKKRFVFGRINGKFQFLGIFVFEQCVERDKIVNIYKRIASSIDILNMKLFLDSNYDFKVSVNASVWISTALLSYETYLKDSDVRGADLYFRQTDIVRKAGLYSTGDVRGPRVSQWCCADAKDCSHKYLRGDNKSDRSLRRLSFWNEFAIDFIPSFNDLDRLIVGEKSVVISLHELIAFVKNEYTSILKREVNMEPVLTNFIKRFIEEYPTEREKTFANNSLGRFIRQEVPDSLFSNNIVDKTKYKITGSVGQGNWAGVPWLAIFDPRETVSAQEGKYIVFLLPKDSNSIFLTFNQGCTKIRSKYSKAKTLSILREESLKIRRFIDNKGFSCDDIILNLPNDDKSQMYEAGCIFYKEYKLGLIPSENELRSDLEDLMNIYDDYINVFKSQEYWPDLEMYNPGLTVDDWKSLIVNSDIFNKASLDVICSFYNYGGEATCAQLAEKYGNTPAHYNMTCLKLAEKIVKTTGCPMPPEDEENLKWWPVLFVGRSATSNEKGNFVWKLRPELKEALSEMDLPNVDKKVTTEFDKNIILYGPPGTGKTYVSAQYAVAICDGLSLEKVKETDYMDRYNELKEEGRIAFTTFHQSYGYEEFIEGIKPVMDSAEQDGDIKYSIVDGVFKEFCDSSFERAWDRLVVAAKENGSKYTFTRRTGTKINAQLMNDNLFSVQFDGEANPHNDIPKLKVKEMYEQYEYENRLDVPNGGTRWVFDACYAVIDELIHKYGLSKKSNSPSDNKVFIIDEINRGNISKIFGELITLIEDTKRAGMKDAVSAILPYSKKEFSVPSNVYILGTMNTADRSIAMMDTALRRRFTFKEMMPDSSVISDVDIDGLNIGKMLYSMNKKIEALYDREHTIGHAYFTGLTNESSVKDLAKIFANKIIPLLQEYFYDDYDKIMLILGDNKKKDEPKFIEKTANDFNNLFGTFEDSFDLQPTYKINEKAFNNIDAYKFI